MGSQEDSYRMGGWSLCPQPCAGAAILDQALLSVPEGLLRCRLDLGQQQLSGLPCWVSMRGHFCPGWDRVTLGKEKSVSFFSLTLSLKQV